MKDFILSEFFTYGHIRYYRDILYHYAFNNCTKFNLKFTVGFILFELILLLNYIFYHYYKLGVNIKVLKYVNTFIYVCTVL